MENRLKIVGNPAIRTMMIGVHRDGWWDEVKLMRQCEDLLDMLEEWDRYVSVIYHHHLAFFKHTHTHTHTSRHDKYQFVGHFDQSVQHNKKGSDGLMASRVNSKWGGTQAKIRDFKIGAGDLGPHVPVMYRKGQKWVKKRRGVKSVPMEKKKVGDTISCK